MTVDQPPPASTEGRRARRARTAQDRPRFKSGFANVRDLLSFLGGLGIVLNEVFLAETLEEAAVGAGFALMGLPVVYRTDERKR